MILLLPNESLKQYPHYQAKQKIASLASPSQTQNVLLHSPFYWQNPAFYLQQLHSCNYKIIWYLFHGIPSTIYGSTLMLSVL